jgi:CBS domain-containing protein
VGEAAGDAVLCVHGAITATVVASALRPKKNEWVAVVVDDDGKPVGVLHAADALGAPSSVRAERIARRVAPVRESAPLAHAVDRMVREHARALPVTDEAGRVVGLLTDLDLLAWVARRARCG